MMTTLARLKRLAQILRERHRLSDFVVQHRVDAAGRQQRIVIVVQNRLDVVKSFASCALANLLNKGGIDVYGVNLVAVRRAALATITRGLIPTISVTRSTWSFCAPSVAPNLEKSPV
jgi:hypothetical protein